MSCLVHHICQSAGSVEYPRTHSQSQSHHRRPAGEQVDVNARHSASPSMVRGGWDNPTCVAHRPTVRGDQARWMSNTLSPGLIDSANSEIKSNTLKTHEPNALNVPRRPDFQTARRYRDKRRVMMTTAEPMNLEKAMTAQRGIHVQQNGSDENKHLIHVPPSLDTAGTGSSGRRLEDKRETAALASGHPERWVHSQSIPFGAFVEWRIGPRPGSWRQTTTVHGHRRLVQAPPPYHALGFEEHDGISHDRCATGRWANYVQRANRRQMRWLDDVIGCQNLAPLNGTSPSWFTERWEMYGSIGRSNYAPFDADRAHAIPKLMNFKKAYAQWAKCQLETSTIEVSLSSSVDKEHANCMRWWSPDISGADLSVCQITDVMHPDLERWVNDWTWGARLARPSKRPSDHLQHPGRRQSVSNGQRTMRLSMVRQGISGGTNRPFDRGIQNDSIINVGRDPRDLSAHASQLWQLEGRCRTDDHRADRRPVRVNLIQDRIGLLNGTDQFNGRRHTVNTGTESRAVTDQCCPHQGRIAYTLKRARRRTRFIARFTQPKAVKNRCTSLINAPHCARQVELVRASRGDFTHTLIYQQVNERKKGACA